LASDRFKWKQESSCIFTKKQRKELWLDWACDAEANTAQEQKRSASLRFGMTYPQPIAL
jgi:hypothetical protein